MKIFGMTMSVKNVRGRSPLAAVNFERTEKGEIEIIRANLLIDKSSLGQSL